MYKKIVLVFCLVLIFSCAYVDPKENEAQFAKEEADWSADVVSFFTLDLLMNIFQEALSGIITGPGTIDLRVAETALNTALNHGITTGSYASKFSGFQLQGTQNITLFDNQLIGDIVTTNNYITAKNINISLAKPAAVSGLSNSFDINNYFKFYTQEPFKLDMSVIKESATEAFYTAHIESGEIFLDFAIFPITMKSLSARVQFHDFYMNSNEKKVGPWSAGKTLEENTVVLKVIIGSNTYSYTGQDLTNYRKLKNLLNIIDLPLSSSLSKVLNQKKYDKGTTRQDVNNDLFLNEPRLDFLADLEIVAENAPNYSNIEKYNVLFDVLPGVRGRLDYTFEEKQSLFTPFYTKNSYDNTIKFDNSNIVEFQDLSVGLYLNADKFIPHLDSFSTTIKELNWVALVPIMQFNYEFSGSILWRSPDGTSKTYSAKDFYFMTEGANLALWFDTNYIPISSAVKEAYKAISLKETISPFRDLSTQVQNTVDATLATVF